MPIPSSLLSERMAVRRKSNNAGSHSFPFNAAKSLSFSEPIRLMVMPQSLTASKSITITGTLNTVPQTEVLTIPTSGIVRSLNRWSTITNVTSVSTGAGSIMLQVVYGSNEDAVIETEVYADVPCRLEVESTPNLVDSAVGFALVRRVMCLTNLDDIQVDDILEIDGIRYRVEDPNPVSTPAGFHHREAYVERLGAP